MCTALLVTAFSSLAVTEVALFKLNVISSAVDTPLMSVPSPLICKVSPNFLTALVPELEVKVMALFANSFSCDLFTASVSLTPAVTLVILWLPASMPWSLLMLAVPTVTLSKLTCFAVAKLNLLAV